MRFGGILKTGAGIVFLVGVSAWPAAQAPDMTQLPGANFPHVGGNLANLRHSTLTKINKTNIKRLGAAWMVHVEPGKSGLWMQATPVVVDGVMYLAHGHITARDARTGALKWQYP
jgi:glucose dehydrogenase